MTKQSLLFNPDIHPVKYALENGTLDLTFDERLMTFWVTQKDMSVMFDLDVRTISQAVARFKSERPEDIETAICTLRITASDGKFYNVEHYNHSVAMSIAYRAHATDKAIRFQRYAETSFQEKMQRDHARAMHKAQHKRAGDVTEYMIGGKTQSHAEKRVDSKDTFKQMSAAIMRLAEPVFIGQIVSKEYILLYGKTTNELKTILRNEKIRDALPEFQLEYLEWTEKTLTRVLSLRDRMTNDELMALAIQTITPIAEHMKMMCDLMGIDRVTGQKLIGMKK